VVWTEHGGPGVGASQFSEGFGSKLVQRTVAGHLGGSISYEWADGGLVVRLRMKVSNLAS
jgi:two-component sensor histidine kinase